jgi:hypothetical protein
MHFYDGIIPINELHPIAPKPNGCPHGFVAEARGRRWLFKRLEAEEIQAEALGREVYRALGFFQPYTLLVRDGDQAVGIALVLCYSRMRRANSTRRGVGV